MNNLVCDSCTYPYAFYNKTEGYKGAYCINETNRWSVLKEEPAKIETYSQACQIRGECICRVPNDRCTFTCLDYYLSLCNSHTVEYGGAGSPLNIVANQTQKYRAFLIKEDAPASTASGRGGRGPPIVPLTPAQIQQLRTAAQEVKLSFAIKDLTYWCPSVTAPNSGEESREKGRRGSLSSLQMRRPNIRYAPKEAVIAIDSYCTFKMRR